MKNLDKILLVCFFLINSPIYSQDASEIFKKASKSTGFISDNRYWGSGFFINERIFVTNFHVIKNMTENNWEIRTQSDSYSISRIVDINKDVDIALLEISDSTSDYLSIADPLSISVGLRVFAIGNPTSQDMKIFKNTFTEGIINNITKDKMDKGEIRINSKVILHSAELNPGNSGGPLINSNSEVVGINSYVRYNLDLMKFAIHADELIALLEKNGINFHKGKNKFSDSSKESEKINNSDKNPLVILDSLITRNKTSTNDSASYLMKSLNDKDNTLFYMILFLGIGVILFVIILYPHKKVKPINIPVKSDPLPNTLTRNRKPFVSDNSIAAQDLKKSFLIFNDRSIYLQKAEMIAGRDSTCDIFISDKILSRFHFSINFTEKGYLITDMGSKNGTFINGNKITSKILSNGDIVSIGQNKILFKVQ